jgi:hypothetical protein
MSERKPIRVTVAIDVALNVLTGGLANVTISSRALIEKGKGRHWAWLYAFLNRIQRHHCELAVANDVERARAALAYLNQERA